MEIYKAVRRLGYNVDFVFEDDEIDSYRLLIVPYAMYLPEKFIEKLEGFKGDILITCMTSIKDEHNWLRRSFHTVCSGSSVWRSLISQLQREWT